MPGPARTYASNAARQAAYRRRCATTRCQEQQAAGLPPLPTIVRRPGSARWRALIRQATQLVETAQAEMQTYYDERSESWRESERGEEFDERLEAVQEAQHALEELSS